MLKNVLRAFSRNFYEKIFSRKKDRAFWKFGLPLSLRPIFLRTLSHVRSPITKNYFSKCGVFAVNRENAFKGKKPRKFEQNRSSRKKVRAQYIFIKQNREKGDSKITEKSSHFWKPENVNAPMQTTRQFCTSLSRAENTPKIWKSSHIICVCKIF